MKSQLQWNLSTEDIVGAFRNMQFMEEFALYPGGTQPILQQIEAALATCSMHT